jgi:hypothetical protein
MRIAQPVTEGVPPRCVINDADARNLRRLLRARCERPRSRRAAEERDEFSPFQLIELHSVPCQPSQRRRHFNSPKVRGPFFATRNRLEYRYPSRSRKASCQARHFSRQQPIRRRRSLRPRHQPGGRGRPSSPNEDKASAVQRSLQTRPPPRWPDRETDFERVVFGHNAGLLPRSSYLLRLGLVRPA